MSSEEIRKKFIEYFSSNGHKQLPAASLLPLNDPSVLFTSAGMQQFRRYYSEPNLSLEARVVTIQPCIRTSDIDEVGDTFHLTFFEMLGNFSFGYPRKSGSYFKQKTIELAWEFLTKELSIEPSRIYATYFRGEKDIPADTESLAILQKISKLPKIQPQGLEDNFWSLGTEGSPGGPTVEFYVDGLEVWNLVFNEYIIKDGKYIPSENKGVDTGMGLERLAVIINGKSDIFAADTFKSIIGSIEKLSGKKCQDFPREFRILADHTRAITNLLAQGAYPSNTGQGYIVRRLIRRSIRIAHSLGFFDDPIGRMVKEYIQGLSCQITDTAISSIISNIESEEDRYKSSLDKIALYRDDLIMAVKYNILKKIHGIPILSKKGIASGRYISENYQSYGTPFDSAINIVLELGLNFDREGFDIAQTKHSDISRSSLAGMFKGGLATGGEMETKYHTATHLLLAALREELSPDIYQKGSNITAERLRFDFNYPQKLTDDQITKIENIVNEKITQDIPVEMIELPKQEALKTVKISFDPTKYGDMVKVYSIGFFSSELCGGPHVKRTGEINGKFKIIKDESSSAGVRRIKAVLQ